MADKEGRGREGGGGMKRKKGAKEEGGKKVEGEGYGRRWRLEETEDEEEVSPSHLLRSF